jgi:hypothetical protein
MAPVLVLPCKESESPFEKLLYWALRQSREGQMTYLAITTIVDGHVDQRLAEPPVERRAG